MIRCCNHCPARRLRCHVWGECVHYMNEKYQSDELLAARNIEQAGAYGMAESWAVNGHFRDTLKRDRHRRKG